MTLSFLIPLECFSLLSTFPLLKFQLTNFYSSGTIHTHTPPLPSEQQQYYPLKLNLRESSPAGVKTEGVPGMYTYLLMFAPRTVLLPPPIPGHILFRLNASVSAVSQPQVSSWGRNRGTGNGYLHPGRQNP